MIYSSILLLLFSILQLYSTDKVLMDTFLSKLGFPSLTFSLTILIHFITHVITLIILHYDENLFKICGTISSSSTLLMFTVTVTLTYGSPSFSSKAFLSSWFTQLDSSFHETSGPFTKCLTLSWLDGDGPQINTCRIRL